jgi:hypothetical protein
MRQIELRNGRMINKNPKEGNCAYHDLFIDGKEVLHEELYTVCYNYVLNNCDNEDFYTEPDASPNYPGETVRSLKIQEIQMKQILGDTIKLIEKDTI